MRILHVSSTSTLSGAHRYAFDLAAGQKDLGHDPIVAMPANPGLAFDFARADVEKAPLKAPRALAFLHGVARLKPDVIHVHAGGAARWTRFIVNRPPILATLHTPYKAVMTHFDGVHALADWQLDALSDFKGVVRKINNWTPQIPPSAPGGADRAREAARAQPSDFLLAFVGRLDHVKGVDVLFDAMARLPDARLRLAIVGSGLLEAEIRERAAQDPRITFIGYTPTPADWYAGADLIVMPSRHEPFALVALEAMAAHAPVIATTVGGFPEIFGGSSADLVPPEDAAALAAAIKRRVEAKTAPGIARLSYDITRFDRRAGVAAVTDFYRAVIAHARSGKGRSPDPGSHIAA